ncbi:MAG: hypothetical protein P1T08_14930 [Acidimicrobiia bacterium]|nr:hypothetical protein [Acidimicrobiia bacterium]
MDAASERGMATPQFVLAAGLSLLLFVTFANLIVFQYGRGVVRAALDEGVRAGAPLGASPDDCQDRIDSFVGDLLGGEMGRGVETGCGLDGNLVVANARVQFEGWVVPDWEFSLTATAVKETLP